MANTVDYASWIEGLLEIKLDLALYQAVTVKVVQPDKLAGFSEFGLTFSVYPYAKTINAADFKILPYEEYTKDLLTGKRSSYRQIPAVAREIFGIILGVIIALVFLVFRPAELISIQSIVSILGAYTIGKDIWGDLEVVLIDITRNWFFNWREPEFPYRRENFGTIQKFWELARYERNQIQVLLPNRLDYISNAHSKTAELLFNRHELQPHVQANSRFQVASVNFAPEAKQALMEQGMQLVFKVTLMKRFIFGELQYEFFQALDTKKRQVGAVSAVSSSWLPKAALHRLTWNYGRIKIYLNSRILTKLLMVSANV